MCPEKQDPSPTALLSKLLHKFFQVSQQPNRQVIISVLQTKKIIAQRIKASESCHVASNCWSWDSQPAVQLCSVLALCPDEETEEQGSRELVQNDVANQLVKAGFKCRSECLYSKILCQLSSDFNVPKNYVGHLLKMQICASHLQGLILQAWGGYGLGICVYTNPTA